MMQCSHNLRKFLLIPTTGIGDTIQFTPVMKNLKIFLPDAEITVFVGSEAAADALARNPYVEHTLVLEGRSHRAWLSLAFRHRLRRGSVDAILASAGIPSYYPFMLGPKLVVAFQGSVGKFTGRDRLWFTLTRNTSLNEVEENLKLLEPLGVRESELKTDLFIGEEDRIFASGMWEDYKLGDRCPVFAIHSQCDTPEKRWGDAGFARLIGLLIDTYPECTVLLIGGPGEDVEGVLESVGDSERCLNLVGRTSILESAAVIQRCDLVISNDSSMAHVAAAVGTPVVTIFGPSDPRRVTPWNPGGRVRVVSAGLVCSPCYLLYSGRIKCRYGKDDIRCMKSITPEMVLEEVIQLVDHLATSPKTDVPSR